MNSLLKTKIIWEPNGVFIQASGIATFEETFQLLQSIVTNPRFKKARYRIYDFLKVKHFEHDKDGVKSHALVSKAGSSVIKQQHKMAFIANDTEHNRQMFELYAQTISSKNIELRFCTSLREARTWAK